MSSHQHQLFFTNEANNPVMCKTSLIVKELPIYKVNTKTRLSKDSMPHLALILKSQSAYEIIVHIGNILAYNGRQDVRVKYF